MANYYFNNLVISGREKYIKKMRKSFNISDAIPNSSDAGVVFEASTAFNIRFESRSVVEREPMMELSHKYPDVTFTLFYGSVESISQGQSVFCGDLPVFGRIGDFHLPGVNIPPENDKEAVRWFMDCLQYRFDRVLQA